MYRSALRAAPARIITPRTSLNAPTRRFISTAPTKRRSWKSSAFRIALVAGGVYYYNTSNVFAEEPEHAIQRLDDSIHAVQESEENTIDAIIEEKKQRRLQQAAEEQAKERLARAALENAEAPEAEEGDGLDGLEEEAGQQGAFNPETGEINWDCPCLGGMANGPCGEQFKAAFSCFVYSKEEPKGMECIEKFKGMQDCFREHPDVYASELEDDEDEVEEELRAREAAASEKSQPAAAKDSERSAEAPPRESKTPASSSKSHVEEQDKQAVGAQRESQNAAVPDIKEKGDKESELLPKASHDAK